MKNRVRALFEQPVDRREPEENYWVIQCDRCRYLVSEETARRIMRELERRRPSKWLRFRDLFGSETRLRSDGVQFVEESTADQRAQWRAFRKARNDEEEEDEKPWEND